MIVADDRALDRRDGTTMNTATMRLNGKFA